MELKKRWRPFPWPVGAARGVLLGRRWRGRDIAGSVAGAREIGVHARTMHAAPTALQRVPFRVPFACQPGMDS
jgi:hypothetical protein